MNGLYYKQCRSVILHLESSRVIKYELADADSLGMSYRVYSIIPSVQYILKKVYMRSWRATIKHFLYRSRKL
jgi:hypothetical protein